MKITIESTGCMVEIVNQGTGVPARLWTGKTESGIEVQVLVSGIAVRASEDQAEFQAELQEVAAPTPDALAFPLRMVM